MALQDTDLFVVSRSGTNYKVPASDVGGASVTNSDTPPANPDEGDLWYNTVSGGLYVYYTDPTSSQWVGVAAGGDDLVLSSLDPLPVPTP